MQLILLLLLICCGIILSIAIDKRVEETLPPFVFAFLIFLYILAILKKPHHAFELSIPIPIGIYVLFVILKRRAVPSISMIKDSLSFKNAPGFWCYLAVVLIMFYCYGNHAVNNWDDFHFNATFARNMFVYNGMPTGWKAATGYKTYKPFMQMFYNWGFQGVGYFSEPLMFRYKSFLLFTAMLPLFDIMRKVKGTVYRIIVFVTALILPFCFMFEVVDSLSMDGMMGILFGYSLISTLLVKEHDWFYYVRIMLGLTALVMVKSTGIIFCGVVVGTWFLVTLIRFKGNKPIREIVRLVLTCIPAGILWLSWKIFCDANGNTTFLNNILSGHLDAESGLPSYGKQTIIDGIKQLFTRSMNLGPIGLTFMCIAAIAVIVLIVLLRREHADASVKVTYACLLACIIPYIAVLLYTYIFVFFDYEAIELASYDRYLGTYALGMMIFIIYQLYDLQDQTCTITAAAICAVLLVTLNYPNLYNGLIPGNYAKYREGIIAERSEAQSEIDKLGFALPDGIDAAPVLIVNNSGNDVYSRSLDYCMLPLVASAIDITSYAADTDLDGYADTNADYVADRFDGGNSYTGGSIEDIQERMANGYDGYVYFTDRLIDSGKADIMNVLLENGSIQKGTIYRCKKGAPLVPVQ